MILWGAWEYHSIILEVFFYRSLPADNACNSYFIKFIVFFISDSDIASSIIIYFILKIVNK